MWNLVVRFCKKGNAKILSQTEIKLKGNLKHAAKQTIVKETYATHFSGNFTAALTH